MDDIAHRVAASMLPTGATPSRRAFHAVLASFCFVLLPGPLGAQSHYPHIVGSGEDRTIEYGPGPHGNIVGGGHVAVRGGGEDTLLMLLDPPTGQSPRPRMVPVVVAGGEHTATVWVPADTDSLRQALIGGDGSLPEVASSDTSVQSASHGAGQGM